MLSSWASRARSVRGADLWNRARRVLLQKNTGGPEASRWVHVERPPITPSLSLSYVHGTSSVSLLSSTVGDILLGTVERHPDREAMVFLGGVRKTFQQFQQDVDQAAAGLLALGLQPGDRLGMWGPNSYQWILMQFSTAKAGIILVSVNPAYQVKEAEFALKKVGCKALVCPSVFKVQKYYEMLRKICPEMETSTPGDIRSPSLPELRSVVLLDSREPGTLHFDDLMQAGSSRYVQQLNDLQRKLSFDDPINIQFTSGTTGAPKGATLTHHNIVNNAYFVGRRVGFDWRPDPRVCLPVPMYHCFGSVGGGLCMAVHGITLVFPSPGYSCSANLQAVERERCTFFYGTPTMFVDLLNSPDREKHDLSSLEAGIMAGSPCPPDLMRRLIDECGIKEVTIGYGTTENSPVTFCGFPLDNLDRKCHTVGTVMEHLEAKVVDPQTRRVVPVGVQGEVLIRGYGVMLEYWGDRDKTKETITRDRWYQSGDLGTLDSYGYLRISGRIKDLIIRGGENIYPAEIESFLHTHPQVQEVQVVGVRDERLGEEVCAAIKLLDGEKSSEQEIKEFCRGQITHFKIPRYVQFVSDYPLTVTGKVQKLKLRQRMEEQLGLQAD